MGYFSPFEPNAEEIKLFRELSISECTKIVEGLALQPQWCKCGGTTKMVVAKHKNGTHIRSVQLMSTRAYVSLLRVSCEKTGYAFGVSILLYGELDKNKITNWQIVNPTLLDDSTENKMLYDGLLQYAIFE